MKTLIIFASKYGCTEKCTKVLKDKLTGEVVVVDIKKNNIPDINLFDNVAIGGSIYAGRIQKEITEFCSKNIDVLKNKKIGLFICCSREKEDAVKQIDTCFPQELISIAVVKEHFGGGFTFSKMNFFEKSIIKMISKHEKQNVNKDGLNILEDNIQRFAQTIESK